MLRWAVIAFPVVSAVWVPLGSAGQFNFTLTDALLLVVLLGVQLSSKTTPKRATRILETVLLLELLTAATAIVHFDLQQGVIDAMIQAKRFVEYSLIVIPASRINPNNRRLMFLLLLALAVIVASVAVSDVSTGQARATSLFFYSNNYGLYCAILFSVSSAFLYFETCLSRWEKILAVIAVGASVLGLVLSGSRAASMGFVASALVLIALLPRSRRPHLLASAGVLIALVLIGFSVSKTDWTDQNVLSRWREALEQKEDTIQVSSRLDAGKYAWAALRDQGVIFGLGISGVPFYTARYIDGPLDWRIGTEIHNTGSQFMQVLTELGLIGAVLFALLMYRMARLCWVGSINATSVSASLLMSLTVLVFAGVGMNTFYVPQVMGVVWTLVGFRIGEKQHYYDASPFVRRIH